MGRRSWGCRHSRQGGGFGIADVVFRADHPNKYDGDDGCGSMMMEDGDEVDTYQISVVSDDG